MSHRRVTFLLAGLFLAACGGGEPPQEEAATTAEAPSDEEALDGLAEYYQTHFNMHHPSMVASVYADSAFALQADGSVDMGKAAIEASLTESMGAQPTIEVSPMHRKIFGDLAVTMGTYSIRATPEGGEPMEYGGSYLSVASKATGEWKIVGQITNYDSERPEGWAWGEGMAEAPEEEGTMGDLIAEYTRHWNLNHPSMVADFYTDDAVVAFSNAAMVHGKAEVAAFLEGRPGPPTTLAVHDVGTMPLGEGYAVDGGWYELTADGQRVQGGAYLNVLQQQADGSWKIQWGETNAQPPQGM